MQLLLLRQILDPTRIQTLESALVGPFDGLVISCSDMENLPLLLLPRLLEWQPTRPDRALHLCPGSHASVTSRLDHWEIGSI